MLIIDDHEGFRARARAVLDSDGFQVVGEAADGEAGIDAAARLRPDVVLIDVQLPDMDGFAVANRLCELGIPARVVLTSSRDASDFGPLVRKCGALGFIPKAELSGAALGELVG